MVAEDSQQEAVQPKHIANTKATVDDSSRLPEISVSRTSTESKDSRLSRKTSGPTTDQAARHSERPRLSRVSTDQQYIPRWRPFKRSTADTWKRGHSPAPEWHIKWKADCFQNGRVLIIDYISNDASPTTNGKRHIQIAAQEFMNLPELRKFYSDSSRVHGAALRVIHVQNASWATMFLLKKFNINHPSEIVGMQSFSKWAQYEKPRQRNGKPFPNGRSWREQMDPWRNVSRTAFGLDYMKLGSTAAPTQRVRRSTVAGQPLDAQMMHLNTYEDSRSPWGHDVAVQRLSVYVQRNLGPVARISPDMATKNPYEKQLPNGNCIPQPKEESKVLLEYLDNSNTVIVFETSASMQLDDCLVQPRNEFEKRWRRLSFYLRKDDVLNDSRLAAQCTNLILNDIFHGLAFAWDTFLSAASDHVALLEDKIYENPADESRAPELWTNQALWLKVDKIMWMHTDIIREMQGHMRDLAEADEELDSPSAAVVEWLSGTPAEYDRLAHTLSEDLVQPTNNLSDLMYKSVGIRDSRQSLQLGLSMWRLSWITFIFLPLTFLVGIFGMNVDTFAGNPSIGWYFMAAVILMVLVLALWYGVKHSLQRVRQTPYQRGLYEDLYHKLEDDYPELWTNRGAVDNIVPTGIVNRVKWRLLKRWFAPEKTIDKKLYSALAPEGDTADLGAWAGFKRALLFRWLPQILRAPTTAKPSDPIALAEVGAASSVQHYEAETLSELARFSTPVVVAEAEPAAVLPLAAFGLRPLSITERRASEDRPSSRGSSGIMIEERNLSDSESEAGGEGVRLGALRGRRASG